MTDIPKKETKSAKPVTPSMESKRAPESFDASPERSYDLLRFTEERTRTLEYELRRLADFTASSGERASFLENELRRLVDIVQISEQRTRTLEYLASENLYISRYHIDLLHKLAADSASNRHERNGAYFRARDTLELITEHHIASGSNDHLQPESTTEGLVRPTPFVRHCIEKLGNNIQCLDLGTGAAGLIYEFARNGVLAVGVDGSDFNARYKIGYWPFIPDNLFTCDITKPFRFKRRANGADFGFDIVSMWEVLEHIAEPDLPALLKNVWGHLLPDGYFIGSISLLEYADKNGTPYHVTLQPKEWWAERLRESGLTMLENHPFNPRFFCRGIGGRFQDVHDYFEHPEQGFHFVARRQLP